MHTLRFPSPRAAAVVAFVAFALAAAVVVQDSGPNQAAHFALVRALASGTAEIDPRETIDAAYVDGRYYAAKAPGLALATLPWYGALRGVGLQDASLGSETGYRHRVWELNLFGAVLPMLVLLVLMFVAAERVVPGYGLPASVLLGAGTLLLPFSTLFFDHLLSAALGFAAFVTLLFAREGHRGTWITGAAGLLAGLAIVVEFPLGIVALVLGVYAGAGADRLRRATSYVAGVLVGVTPLLVYNTLAFGSPTTLSYTNALKAPAGNGVPVVGANASGFYGVGLPDPRVALSLFASEKGLLVVTPLAVAALFGLPLLWRAGRRAEALVCAAIPLLFLAYNSAYYLPYGGQSPGPRFLVPALPFLVLPLAFVLRARPLVIAGIGLASVGVMALATITGPSTGVEYSIDTWFDRLGRGETVETVTGRLGVGPAWVAALPFALLLAITCGVALARVPFQGALRREAPLVAGVVGAWLLVVLVTPDLIPADEAHQTDEGALAVVVLFATIAIALHVGQRSSWLALLVLAPAFVLAAPALGARPRWSLLVALVVLAGAAGVWIRLWRHPLPTPSTVLEVDPPRETGLA
jgi:hypothetical protein